MCVKPPQPKPARAGADPLAKLEVEIVAVLRTIETKIKPKLFHISHLAGQCGVDQEEVTRHYHVLHDRADQLLYGCIDAKIAAEEKSKNNKEES